MNCLHDSFGDGLGFGLMCLSIAIIVWAVRKYPERR